jgi:hypothetical protein
MIKKALLIFPVGNILNPLSRGLLIPVYLTIGSIAIVLCSITSTINLLK